MLIAPIRSAGDDQEVTIEIFGTERQGYGEVSRELQGGGEAAKRSLENFRAKGRQDGQEVSRELQGGGEARRPRGQQGTSGRRGGKAAERSLEIFRAEGRQGGREVFRDLQDEGLQEQCSCREIMGMKTTRTEKSPITRCAEINSSNLVPTRIDREVRVA